MKIIATDYDGTLNHNGITDKKRQAISEWRKGGNLFGVVSGRGIRSLFDIIRDKNFEYDFLIANNGAVICNSKREIVNEFICDGKVAKPFIEDLFSWDCPFANIDKDVSIMVKANKNDCEENEIVIDDLSEIDYFNQINTMLENEDEAHKVVLKIREKYSYCLNPLQNGRCIDITPAGVDKASGIYALLKVVGASYGDVIAVGDNINDEAMIREFKSYAMANGVQYIKDIADDITEGISELIKKEMTSTNK